MSKEPEQGKLIEASATVRSTGQHRPTEDEIALFRYFHLSGPMTRKQKRVEQHIREIVFRELRNAVDRDPECSFAMRSLLRIWLERQQRKPGEGRPSEALRRAIVRDWFRWEVAAHPERDPAAIRKELGEQLGIGHRRMLNITK